MRVKVESKLMVQSELDQEVFTLLLEALTAGQYQKKSYSPGSLIFKEHEEFSGVFSMKNGYAQIARKGPNGSNAEQLMYACGPFCVLGTTAWFQNKRYPATIRALTSVEGYYIPAESFALALSKRPNLPIALIRQTCHRIQLLEKLAYVQNNDLHKRLRELLLLLAHTHGLQKTGEFEKAITPQYIANLMAKPTQTIMSGLLALAQQNLVSLQPRGVRVLPALFMAN